MSIASIDQSQRAGIADGDITQLWRLVSLKNGTGPQGNEEDHSRLKSEMNKHCSISILCPEQFVDIEFIGQLSPEAGYFRFGQNTCYRVGFRISNSSG